MKEQIKLQQELQYNGFNIVTCGNCGNVLIHKIGIDEIHCVHCDMNMELSECPDLYYKSMED